jgi:hypothetical protein
MRVLSRLRHVCSRSAPSLCAPWRNNRRRMGFDNNIFAGPKNESPFSINQFLNTLIFIRIVNVLELTTFSNHGHFDHCTLCLGRVDHDIWLGITVASITLIVLDVSPLTYISVQGIGSLTSSTGYLSLYLFREEPALLGAKGWTVASRFKLISEICIYTT